MRASADGRLAVSGTDVSTVVAADPAPRRPQPRRPGVARGRGGRLAGHDLPVPRSGSTRPCGEGPGALGRRHHGADPARRPTVGALGRGRPALDGVRPRRARCRDHPRRRRAGRRGAAPGIRRPASAQGRCTDAAPTPLDVARQSPTHLTGTVGAGPQRLLALTMNHNDGLGGDARRRGPHPDRRRRLPPGLRRARGGLRAARGAVRPGRRPTGAALGARAAARPPRARSLLLVPDRSRWPSAPAGTADAVPRPAVVAARRARRRAARRRTVGRARRGRGARGPAPAPHRRRT